MNLQPLISPTSSWYQRSVHAQLALISDSVQFVLMPWFLQHSTHFVHADQREERAFSSCWASSFQPPPSWQSLPTTILQAWCLPGLPSSTVGFGPHFCKHSVETLSLCLPCSSPPSASNSASNTAHAPRVNHLSQADVAPELPPAWKLAFCFWNPTWSGVSNHRKK